VVPINCITFVAGDPRIGQYVRQGGTIYRNSGDRDKVTIVSLGASHSAAWASVKP
jgi:hypothetical protein